MLEFLKNVYIYLFIYLFTDSDGNVNSFINI